MVKDNYKEHVWHKTYEKDCSTCWSENLRLKERKEALGVPIGQERTQVDDPRWNENPLE